MDQQFTELNHEESAVGCVLGVRLLIPPTAGLDAEFVKAVRKFLKSYKHKGNKLKGFTRLDNSGNLIVGSFCNEGAIDVFLVDDNDLSYRLRIMYRDFLEAIGNLHYAESTEMELLVLDGDGNLYSVSIDPEANTKVLYEAVKEETAW